MAGECGMALVLGSMKVRFSSSFPAGKTTSCSVTCVKNILQCTVHVVLSFNAPCLVGVLTARRMLICLNGRRGDACNKKEW